VMVVRFMMVSSVCHPVRGWAGDARAFNGLPRIHVGAGASDGLRGGVGPRCNALGEGASFGSVIEFRNAQIFGCRDRST
jgi:hypothetical protein